MLDNIFRGVFDTGLTETIEVEKFLLCLCGSLIIGGILAASHMYRTRYSKSFVVTLALLPAVVCVIIMMVNGNVGAGVVAGMGYLGFALLFTLIMCGLCMLSNVLDLGAAKNAASYKTLNITIPEDLDYTGVFEQILKDYTKECELVRVKTTNMGSMFRLSYDLTLREGTNEKELIDQLRCRNGNLEIMLAMQESTPAEL